MSENPYQTPQSSTGPVVQDSAAEEIRKSLINHEASVKSVSILYFIAAVMMIIVGLVGMFTDEEASFMVKLLMATFFIRLGLLHFGLASACVCSGHGFGFPSESFRALGYWPFRSAAVPSIHS